MLTEINGLSVPEVRSYSHETIEGGVVICYELRQPGERNWTPVRLFRPTDPNLEERVTCLQCGEAWPRRTMSAGVCVPCTWGGCD